jgi:hypothetical protein
MKKTTHFQFWKPALVVGLSTFVFTGCQSRQLSWLGAEARPTRIAPHTFASPPQAIASTSQAPQVHQQTTNHVPTRVIDQAKPNRPTQDVVQVQYTEPIQQTASEPFAMAVPREPMGIPVGPMMGSGMGAYSGYAPIPPGNGCATCGPPHMSNRSYALHSHRHHPGRT